VEVGGNFDHLPIMLQIDQLLETCNAVCDLFMIIVRLCN
jgi:hypothetical protein